LREGFENKQKPYNYCFVDCYFASIFGASHIVSVISTYPKKLTNSNVSTPFKTFGSTSSVEHVSFRNVTFTDIVTIGNNSIVRITDSNITSDTIYVYDCAELILENVSAPYGTTIKLYDNTTLILKNSNISVPYMYFYVYDHAKIYIINSFLNKSNIYANDFSETYIYNAAINYMYFHDNSTAYLTNVTLYFHTYLYDNSSITVEHATFDGYWYFRDNSSGILCNVAGTSVADIRLYDYSNVIIENSTLDDLSLIGYSTVTIINCVLNDIYINQADQSYYHYGGYRSVPHIYNSTFDILRCYSELKTYLTNVRGNTVCRGFIIEGTGNVSGSTVYMSSGTFEYNVVNDTSSRITDFNNATYFTFKNSNFHMENIAAERIAAYNSCLQIHGGAITVRTYGYNSTFNIYGTTLPYYVEFEKSTAVLNATTGCIELLVEYSNITAVNSTSFLGLRIKHSALLIVNSTVFLFAYNNSQVYFDFSGAEGIFAYDYSKIYINSSSTGLMCSDNAYVSVFNSTVYTTLLQGNSTVYADKTKFICEISVWDNANITVINSNISESYSTIVTLTNNSYALFKNVRFTSTDCDAIIQANDSSEVIFENVFIEADGDYFEFTLWGNAQLKIINSKINTTSTILGIGLVLDNAMVYINVTQIFRDTSTLSIELRNTTTLTTFNVSSFAVLLCDSAKSFMYNSNVTRIVAMEHAYFEAISRRGFDSSTTIEMYDNSVGKIVNHSIYSLYQSELTQFYLENVYANFSGSFIYLEEQARLTALNLTAAGITTDFLVNLSNMGYVNLTNSKIGKITEEISIYHYGNTTINGKRYIAEATVDIFNHTILQRTTVNEKESALNIEEFINAVIGNITYTHVSVKRLVDTQAPIVSVTPPSTEFEKGMIVEDMKWTILEEHPDVYELEKNGTIIMNGTYNSGEAISLNISAFDPGFWTLKLTAKDRAGYSTTILSNVTVYPSEPPIFTVKPPRTYEMTEGSTGNILNWTATDRFPANYEIYVDNELKAAGTWTSGVKIEYNIDNLTEGNHAVKIVVYDLAGNSAEDTVSVIVKPAVGFPWTYIPIIVGVTATAVIIVIVIKKHK